MVIFQHFPTSSTHHVPQWSSMSSPSQWSLGATQEDSLARQLRALKEAKELAANQLAKSEKQIAQRQEGMGGAAYGGLCDGIRFLDVFAGFRWD